MSVFCSPFVDRTLFVRTIAVALTAQGTSCCCCPNIHIATPAAPTNFHQNAFPEILTKLPPISLFVSFFPTLSPISI